MNTNELRKQAEAATQGPWKWIEGTPIITRQWNGKDCAIAAVDYKGLAWHEDSNCAGREAGANAAYIAAANPVQAIALLDEIDRLNNEAVAADIRISNDEAIIVGLTDDLAESRHQTKVEEAIKLGWVKRTEVFEAERDALRAANVELYGSLKHLAHNARKSGADMGLALDFATEALAMKDQP